MWLMPVIRCRILSDHLIISFVILHLIRISESELSVVSERSVYLTIIKIGKDSMELLMAPVSIFMDV